MNKKKLLLLLLLLKTKQRQRESRSARPTLDVEQKFDFQAASDDDCVLFFRFKKDDLIRVFRLLRVPGSIVLPNRARIDGFTAFLVVLRRLAYPSRLVDLSMFFGRTKEVLSFTCNWMYEYIWHHFGCLFLFDQRRLTPETLEQFVTVNNEQGAALQDCWSFIDGTVRPIARPQDAEIQLETYNGHKRVNALKFQSIVTPDGLIVDMGEGMSGRRHDSGVYNESGAEDRMLQYAKGEDGRQLLCYGDSAYGCSDVLSAPYPARIATQEETAFNESMSNVRSSVEYGFQKVVTLFAYVDFKKGMKLGLMPVGKIYLVSAFFANVHSCLYGNQSATKFQIQPPSLEEYLRTALDAMDRQ